MCYMRIKCVFLLKTGKPLRSQSNWCSIPSITSHHISINRSPTFYSLSQISCLIMRLIYYQLNSLIGGEEFVEGSCRGHFHNQHQVLSFAQTQHADDEGVTQLVHNLCLPHHLFLHQLLIVILQHFDSHIDLTPERKQNKTFWMNI